jgi:hypothetical protein
MSKIIDYTLIISIESSQDLESQVTDAILEDWQPIGGVAITEIVLPIAPNQPKQAWVQAMVKYETPRV